MRCYHTPIRMRKIKKIIIVTTPKACEDAGNIIIQTSSNKGGALEKLRNQFLDYPKYFK